MGKNLVIVESPAKAKTLTKYLGKDYEVKASMGHIIDLPEKQLGVDLEHEFKPTYEIIRGKNKVVNELKRAARAAEQVYLAPDPDREGEAIAWHLAGALGISEDRLHRVLFNEITRDAVLGAMAAPEQLNRNLFEAQQARRVLDRLVGYKISPLLWKVVRGGLSAGRVQSVAVRMVCEREKEIQAYVKKEYWSIVAELLTPAAEKFSARLWSVDEKRLVTRPDTEAERKDRFWIRDKSAAEQIAEELRGISPYNVTAVERKEKKRNPSPPYITSTMQRDAAGRYGWPARKTMQVAQALYEGVEIGGEGSVGLITYMRTDSTRVADTALAEVRKLIAADYGERYLPGSANFYSKAKGKVQDAHEAIRPTSSFRRPDQVRKFLTPDQDKLYRLIWARFVASQMTPAVYDLTTVDIQAGSRFLLRAAGSVLRFAGFTAVYIDSLEKNGPQADPENGEDSLLPLINKGDRPGLEKVTPNQHFTQPPPRFTESSLIRELEANGIGRPSTYAAILSTILDKDYVKRLKSALQPTDLGIAVNELLVEKFPGVLNVKFTAGMEDRLDQVEEGRENWLKVLQDFYRDFKPALEQAEASRKKLTIPTEIACDKCGSPMVIRWSRHGAFLGCLTFPACTNIKQFERDEEGKVRIVEKKPQSTGIPCPRKGCAGELVEKKTRRGKVFWGCNAYPDCEYATWDRPLNSACTKCGARPVFQKIYRGGRPGPLYCASCDAKFGEEDLIQNAG